MLNTLKSYCDKLNKNMLIPSVYLALVIGLIYNPFNNIGVSNFKGREFGQALINGIDSSVRINHLLSWVIFLIPLLFLFIWAITSRLCGNKNEATLFLNKLCAVSLVPLTLGYINRFAGSFSFSYDIVIPFLMAVIITVLNPICQRSHLEFCDVKWSLFSSFPILLFLIIVSKRFGIGVSPLRLGVLYILIFLCAFFVLNLLKKIPSLKSDSIKLSFTWVMCAPLAVSVFLELCNILNQHNIFITKKYLGAVIIYIFLIVLGVIFGLVFGRKERLKPFCFEKYYYPIMLLGLLVICVQMPLIFTQGSTSSFVSLAGTFEVNFFESSNAASAISGFFNFGELPFIQNFDAHMLYSEWSGFLYAFLNADSFGALFNPYKPYMLVLIYMLLYFLYAKFFDRDSAVIICLFMSCLTAFIDYYALGVIVILGAIYAHRKKTLFGYIIMWLCVVICVLMRLDLGFPFAVGLVICLILMALKDKKIIGKILLSLSLVLGACGVLYLILCIIKGVAPIDRALEFLGTASSNTNWSTASIGDVNQILFPICYIITPIVAVGLGISLLYKYLKAPDTIKAPQLIIAVILLFAYILNISRGIVRHSLNEHQVKYVLGTFILFFAFAVYILSKRKMLFSFVASYFSVFLVFTVLMTGAGYTTVSDGYIIEASSLFESSLKTQVQTESFSQIATEKVTRVNLNDDTSKYIDDINAVFDALMTKDGTYLDFTNQTLIYAVSGRQKPVYVNQSPGLISGEKAQQRFLSQIESFGDRIEYALLPEDNSGAIDNIKNSYRYYLVSEYINKNFTPLCSFDSLELWCKKGELDEKTALVNKAINNAAQSDDNVFSRLSLITDFENQSGKDIRFDLGYLPYYWANLDEIKLSDKTVLLNITDGKSVSQDNPFSTDMSTAGIDKTHGNYICLSFSADTDGEVLLSLNSDDVTYTYSFNAVSGTSSYLIRVSSGYYWYEDIFSNLTVSSDCDINNLTITVLKGDTLK